MRDSINKIRAAIFLALYCLVMFFQCVLSEILFVAILASEEEEDLEEELKGLKLDAAKPV